MTTWYQAYIVNISLFLDALKMLHSVCKCTSEGKAKNCTGTLVA